MPKIISTFSGPDPIGAALSNLGKQLFGGDKTASALEAEKLYAAQRQNAETDNLMRMAAEKGIQNLGSDPVTQAILLGSGYGPGDFAKLGLMGAATGFGARDPRTANWQIGSGGSYSGTADAFDRNLAEEARANTLASADRRYNVDQDVAVKREQWATPSAEQTLQHQDRRYNVDRTVGEAARSNDMESADRRYGVDTTASTERFKWGTPSANEQLQSADRRYGVDSTAALAREKPMAALDAQGRPTFAQTGDATNGNYLPILSEENRKGTLLGQNFDNLPALNPQQQEVLGARVSGDKAGTPKNYIVPNGGTMLTYDGITDVQGNPLPPGGYIGTVQGSATDTGVTNAVSTALQGNVIANKKFEQLVGMGRALTQDPTLFGPQGKVRSLAQELAAGVQGMSAVVGKDVNAARDTLAQELAGTGVDAVRILPELYDPNLPKVQTVWGLLVYQGASALAGQENRSVSDADVKNMRELLGDPQSLFSSAQMMQSKLDTALEIVRNFDKVSREALGGNAPVTPAQVPTDGLNVTGTGAQWRVLPNAGP